MGAETLLHVNYRREKGGPSTLRTGTPGEARIMATRTKVQRRTKTKLLLEAGGKCANPGCAHWRTHIHHIRHWQFYRTHEPEHMIAVCPTCHQAIHSKGGITDNTLYEWKGIVRNHDRELVAQIYVEPSSGIRVLAGSMSITTDTEAAVFKLSNSNTFRFRITGDNDVFVANGLILDRHGYRLVGIFDNICKVSDCKLICVDQVPGRLSISILDAKRYLPGMGFYKYAERNTRFR